LDSLQGRMPEEVSDLDRSMSQTQGFLESTLNDNQVSLSRSCQADVPRLSFRMSWGVLQ
jgi:hypothetical protein